jgi:nitrite reductase/ring-hydroxylating ferredoxin subunit/DMSO/TMAO reductase YedYZ heme-binding membrane subunit
MGHVYKAVQWTPFKKRHDLVLGLGVAVFVTGFIASALFSQAPGSRPTEIQIVLRALGAAAFALLTLTLAIGPLARLHPRFAPLLYNRRHIGVTVFLLALAHAALVLIWYHGFSPTNPFLSLLIANPRYDSIQGFPFESLGLLALLILLVMAATSHDFWNALLGPGLWKALHFGAYFAYTAVIGHVVLGALQAEKASGYAWAVGLSAGSLICLHTLAARKAMRQDNNPATTTQPGWLIGPIAQDIPDKRAQILTPPVGEAIAVFRDGDKIYAMSNRCRHQGGPLGEGKIVDGCVTCPWHGFQYRPEDGASPPPYAEKISTYRTRIVGGVVEVDPIPLPTGTPVPPSTIGPRT